MTLNELHEMIINGVIKEHHVATARGYISRKSDGEISSYNGRFGRGYVVRMPRFDSTQYHWITYYIFK